MSKARELAKVGDSVTVDISNGVLQVNNVPGYTANITENYDIPNKEYVDDKTLQQNNLIINGSFDVWQRAASTTGVPHSSGAYGADRFKITPFNLSAGTVDIARGSIVPGASHDGLTKLDYMQTITMNSVSIANDSTVRQCIISQGIEKAKQFSNRTVTFSFWIYATSATSVIPYIYTGAPGVSNPRAHAETKSVPATTWTQITMTATMEDLTGLTVVDEPIAVGVYLVANDEALSNYGGGSPTSVLSFNGTIWTTGWKFEFGDTATKFIRPDFATNIEQCQRFFRKSYDLNTPPGTATYSGCINFSSARHVTNGSISETSTNWDTPMRTAPTIVLYAPATGTQGSISVGSTDRAAAALAIGEAGFVSVRNDSGNPWTDQSILRWQYTAECELF